MLPNKRIHPEEKIQLHARNKHRQRYNFKILGESCPDLLPYVFVNKYGDESINFFDPAAVMMLNKALLKYFYAIDYWQIPPHYLCPPIPGRADYIHYMADLLFAGRKSEHAEKTLLTCLDIGVGANCIYPIIGVREYNWNFVGTDIDPIALKSAQNMIDHNPLLKGKIELRLQANAKNIFKGIIHEGDFFDLCVCNPPFHSSAAEAQAGSVRKLAGLKQKQIAKPVLNFGGKSNELWCPGGEVKFVSDMIHESKDFAKSCHWFSTLVSKEYNLKWVYEALNRAGVADYKTIPMGQGNKISRIIAWTYFK